MDIIQSNQIKQVRKYCIHLCVRPALSSFCFSIKFALAYAHTQMQWSADSFSIKSFNQSSINTRRNRIDEHIIIPQSMMYVTFVKMNQ